MKARTWLLLAPLGVFAAAAAMTCGGRVDDGWDGLSGGGDTDALSPPGSPPGSKCVGYDAAAWFSDPACKSLDDCVALAPSIVPPGWPTLDVGCGVADAGADARVCVPNFNSTAVICNGTEPGEPDAYCRAWALQYAKQAISVSAYCHPNSPGPNYCDLLNENPCLPCDGLCVQRSDGWHCETPCQDPGDDQ